jgi:hypothetical protein
LGAFHVTRERAEKFHLIWPGNVCLLRQLEFDRDRIAFYLWVPSQCPHGKFSATVVHRECYDTAAMKTSLRVLVYSTLAGFISLSLLATSSCFGQVFRLDGGNSTYAFGVNERGELQPLYWGGRLSPRDTVPSAHSFPEVASFDSPYTTTPQEYASWGAGLFTEPALKMTFADGNRDLVLHFVRATPDGEGAVKVLLKDVSREIFVTLRYSIDPETGILARSASHFCNCNAEIASHCGLALCGTWAGYHNHLGALGILPW